MQDKFLPCQGKGNGLIQTQSMLAKPAFAPHATGAGNAYACVCPKIHNSELLRLWQKFMCTIKTTGSPQSLSPRDPDTAGTCASVLAVRSYCTFLGKKDRSALTVLVFSGSLL